MKKRALSLTSLLLICLLLCACGNKEVSAPAAADVQSESTAPVAEELLPPAPVAEELLPPASVAEEPLPPADSGATSVSFELGNTVTHEGLCEMSGLYAEVLDDKAMSQGWYYYYTDSCESPAQTLNWELPDGCYTTAEVLFTVKNTSGEPQTFGDKISAQMLYRESADAPMDCFAGTVFQQNPGQVDESGGIIMWSTKPVEIAPGESANVSFRFDIPKDVYEMVYRTAIGEDTGISESCEFSFGDGTTYVIDLTEALIPASLYEG